MLTDIRDIIIIFGVSASFLLLLISTILVVSTFLKIRKLTKFIENSLEEISDIFILEKRLKIQFRNLYQV